LLDSLLQEIKYLQIYVSISFRIRSEDIKDHAEVEEEEDEK